MKNRAKCKKCGSIIESFHSEDSVTCACTEICVHGGAAMYCSANDWSNFLRVDDDGNEIVPQVITTDDGAALPKQDQERIVTLNELIDALKSQYEYIDNSPVNLQYASVTNSDLSAVLKVIVGIFKRLG